MIHFFSLDVAAGVAMGILFGNWFPWAPIRWERCRTPVSLLLILGFSWLVYQESQKGWFSAIF